MKKNILKITLDLIMLFLLILMFRKNAISMSFHEIGGLALLCVFVFHKILNYKWILGVTKKLFSKSLPAKTRLGYIVDALLLVSFVLVGISGIFISKTVFHLNGGGMAWKMIHYTASAVSLILTGVHLGLHAGFIKSVILKNKRQHKLLAALGIVLTVAIAGYGCYSIGTTSFARWLTMPFTLSQVQGGQSDAMAKGAFDGQQQKINGGGERSNQADGNQRPSQPEGGTGGLSIATALKTIADFFSIAYLFAVITYLIEVLFKRLNRKPASAVV